MYKALLVDDEILIRERISKRIPWEELGYELIATCADGKEAIDMIEQQPIDLVLTDICMPYVDGLELAKYIHSHHKAIKMVIITGYDEFGYAKRAVEYHVFSYVLKPITAEELIQTLKEVKLLLDEEKTNLQTCSRYQDNLSALKNQFLVGLAQGKWDDENIKKKMEEFQIRFEGNCFCSVILVPKVNQDQEALFNVSQMLACEVPKDIFIAEENDENLLLFISEQNRFTVREKVEEVCKQVIDLAKQKLGQEIFCMVGSCVMTIGDLSSSNQKAMELREYLYLERESHIYEWEEYQKAKLEVEQRSFDHEGERKIHLAVQSNLWEDVKREVSAIKEDYRNKWIAKSKVVLRYQGLILSAMNLLEGINVVDEDFFAKEQEIVSGLFSCQSIFEMEEKVLGFFSMAMEAVNRNRVNYGKQQAAIALEYINKHYGDSELSLQVMCEKLAMSMSYFSSVFKNYTGKTFIEALTKRRMEKAMELLEKTTMKTYEIAEKCGYSDANYFSSTFKKMTGKTPREYLKVVRSQEGFDENKN